MSHTYITFPPAPNLPLAPREWDARYQDQFANVLRLYFNQLSQQLQALLGDSGGQHLSFPFGAFHEDGVTTLSSNITNNSTTAIVVASTDGFPSSGYILIDSEIIQYTTKTTTTFDGTITRGVLGTTNVAHTAGTQISEVQGTGSGTTIGRVLFNATDYSHGVYTTNADYSKVFFDKTGIYNVQISAQLLNFTTSEDNVTMWFRLNGNDLPYTASIQQVNAKHGGSPGASILAFNILQELQGGDYIQVCWTSDTGDSVVATYPAGTSPVHPVSPAIIMTATFVSAPTE